MRLQDHERAPGRWDYDGACAPEKRLDGWRYPRHLPDGVTYFTLGCFQWVPRANGNGVKRGKVRYRIKGNMHDPRTAFQEADAYCAKMEAMEAAG